ncbi:hypothetical protein M407DRAFT_14859 [Tulasnella calospora MUT 4182]|uniref:Helitron helicase-like domain-containing protein n=1 Tax=Tulasnella calospora MUT 4182 TaxID=1051891 RepID=A0A0C3QBA2_9AGAM|nr:hypothetical protein M407DRAFT_14859 [Tulasnella calospora MUT 4182]
MFPTLFPYGLGGFEDPCRPVALSFQKQAEYFLDLDDRCFRYHQYYIFVALNIIQRRAVHLQTHLTVKRQHFDSVARHLVTLSPALIKSVADHIESEGRIDTLSQQQLEVINLLNRVNTIASHIPGSQAAKLQDRNTIRSYMGLFGLPPIFFTMNTNAAHSPLFQVYFGDRSVDLSERFPVLVSASERAMCLAKDPVAAADFFHFCVAKFFEYMLGWDYKANRSNGEGGILGKVRAFFGTCEYTEPTLLPEGLSQIQPPR